MADLTEAYGSPFGQRVPITRAAADESRAQAKAEFTSLQQKARESIEKNKGLTDEIARSLNLGGSKTETFRLRAEKPAPVEQQRVRESFTERPVSSSPSTEDKLSRILRLIEQNKTGYERPAVQDMVLYIFTGVFFIFTFDTFVLLGKTMRKIKA